jgi:ATP-dependent DNA helicase RecG
LPDGLFRKTVPHYDEVVVRELLANALVHRPYAQRGDIFINIYPDRLEVHNPGLLPIGVTPRNILHATSKRNPHLAKVFYDLKLMEGEGSGFDRVYQVLLAAGKPVPKVEEGDDRVVVTVRKRIVNLQIVDFMTKADQTFDLTQRERITLGLLAQHESMTALDLCGVLELDSAAVLAPWTGRLLQWNLIRSKGRTKGTEYYVDPELLRKLHFQGPTTLRGIERHRLRELVLQDLNIYRVAGIREIQSRIGQEISIHKIRRELDQLVTEGVVQTESKKRWKKYLITKTG